MQRFTPDKLQSDRHKTFPSAFVGVYDKDISIEFYEQRRGVMAKRSGNDAEDAWMRELNRIGTEEGVRGFPMPPEVLIGGNCFLEDFEAGLTPREAIEDLKRWNKKVGAK